jgi:hypothetical protein
MEAYMPVLLWYFPFIMFSGAFELMFPAPKAQTNRPAPVEAE